MKKSKEMGFAEEVVHHRTHPPRKLAGDHPCVPRKLRSAVIKRNHEESTSPTLPKAKKSSLRVKRIKPKKDVPKKRSRKQSTAMAEPITKDEEEVVETLNALAGIFSASSPPPPPPASSSSAHHMIATVAIDTTPIQFQSSPNSIINTTATQEPIIQTDENKGVLLEPLPEKVVLPSSSITRVSTTDDKKPLRKRCATHVYISHFIKVLQDGKKDEETSRTFDSKVSQQPKLDLLSMSVRGGMEASGSNNKHTQSVVYPEDHSIRSPFIDQIQGKGEQQVRQQQLSTTHLTGQHEERKFDVLRWQGGGTEPGISPQNLFSRTARPSLSSSGYQDKSAKAFHRDVPLSLQLLCSERP